MIALEKKTYLTKGGLEKLRVEFQNLKALRLLKVKEPESESEVEFIDVRLGEFDRVLKFYELISTPPKSMQDTIGLGATVILENGNGKEIIVKIVGTFEAKPPELISNESPLGRAILGKRAGDTVTVQNGRSSKNGNGHHGQLVYTIKGVEYGDGGTREV